MRLFHEYQPSRPVVNDLKGIVSREKQGVLSYISGDVVAHLECVL